MTTPADARVPIHHPQTAARVFSGEAVVISPAENTVRMFNVVGSRIWELADGRRTMDDIAASLVAEFDVEAEHARESVRLFVEELVTRSLLSWA